MCGMLCMLGESAELGLTDNYIEKIFISVMCTSPLVLTVITVDIRKGKYTNLYFNLKIHYS